MYASIKLVFNYMQGCILKGMKKRGKMRIFPNWLKIYKIAKKKAEYFLPAASNPPPTPTQYNQFHLGEKYKSGGGRGKKGNFKFNIHPWLYVYSYIVIDYNSSVYIVLCLFVYLPVSLYKINKSVHKIWFLLKEENIYRPNKTFNVVFDIKYNLKNEEN